MDVLNEVLKTIANEMHKKQLMEKIIESFTREILDLHGDSSIGKILSSFSSHWMPSELSLIGCLSDLESERHFQLMVAAYGEFMMRMLSKKVFSILNST